ncbi:hypothetical protein LTR15_002987 [Elasticomyces elasticus]|nr:hypothetical protein LTR15_002987 [Elasticomyces elasticus]
MRPFDSSSGNSKKRKSTSGGAQASNAAAASEDAASNAQEDRAMSPRPKAPRSAPATKKRKLNDPTITSSSEGASLNPPKHQLPYPDIVSFEVSAGCTHIHKFMGLVDKGLRDNPTAPPFKYAPKPSAKHWSELPVSEGWRFELVESGVELRTYKLPDGDIQAWSMYATDTLALITEEHIPLFQLIQHTEHPPGSSSVRTIPQFSCITKDICPTLEKAKELGRIACKMINHLPYRIDTSCWLCYKAKAKLNKQVLTTERCFVDLASLVHWDPAFDFRQLPKTFFDMNKLPGKLLDRLPYMRNGAPKMGTRSQDPRHALTFNLMMLMLVSSPPVAPKASKKHIVSSPPIAPQAPRKHSDDPQPNEAPPNVNPDSLRVPRDWFKMSVVPSNLDLDIIDSEPEIPEGSWYQIAYTGKDKDSPVMKAAMKSLHLVANQLVGYIGTKSQLQTLINQSVSRYDNLSATSAYQSAKARKGRDNRWKLVDSGGYLQADNLFSLRTPSEKNPITTMRWWLPHWELLIYESPNGETRQVLYDDTQDIVLHSRNIFDVAYVKQQAVNSLAAGKTPLQALFSAHVAADAIELGLVTIDDIKLTLTSVKRTTIELTLSTLARLAHFTLLQQKGSKPGSLEAAFRASLMRIAKKEDIDVPLLLKILMEKHLVPGSDAYEDAYNGQVANFAVTYELLLTPGMMGTWKKGVHHDRVSVEKPFPLYYHALKSKMALHEDENLAATRNGTNMLKGSAIPAAVPWFPRLLRAQDLVEKEPVVRGYHAQVREVLVAFDRFSDNEYMIQNKIPWNSKAKLNMSMTAQDFQALLKEMISGTWDGETRPASKHPLWRTKEWNKSEASLPDADWDGAAINKLKSLLKQMANSSKYNPLGLTLPESADGSPWLWREDLKPVNADWLYLCREFRARLKMWRDFCNRKHPTHESPATLLLLYVFWWYKTGGKCHVFGFIMTLYIRHLANYSFGRAPFWLDCDGKATSRPIPAGAPLSSGITKLMPDDLDVDWILSNITSMPESWKSNAWRGTLPAQLLAEMKMTCKLMKLFTEWYEAVKAEVDYPETPKPTPHSLLAASLATSGTEDAANEDDEEQEKYQEDIDQHENPLGMDIFSHGEVDSGMAAPQPGMAAEPGANKRHLVSDLKTTASEEMTAPSTNPAIEAPTPSLPTINTATLAKIVSRPRGEYAIRNALPQGHQMYSIALHVGQYPHECYGFATLDNTFRAEDGELVGTYDSEGRVFDGTGYMVGRMPSA